MSLHISRSHLSDEMQESSWENLVEKSENGFGIPLVLKEG